MDERNDRFWVEQSLLFFGQVSASLSHEINNVFSIINELAGLIDDHLLRIDQDLPIDPEKLKDASDRIAKQVKRGETLVKLLNRMAHSADHWSALVDVGELVERIVAVCRRFATLRGATLEIGGTGERLEITTNPFLLQQAIFRAVQMCLLAVDTSRSLKVEYEPAQSGGAVISVTGGDPVPDSDERRQFEELLAQCAQELGGSLELEPSGDAVRRVIINVPSGVAA